MSEKFKKTRRCYLIDHHSPQPPIVPLDKMDIEEYDHFFETANIDSLMVYCKDHWGVTYYDSKVKGAVKHKGIGGDWIHTIREKTKEKSIEFIAYYCIEYDEGAARAFPEWRARKSDGSYLIRDDQYAKWSLLCYQTGYREYALSQLEEIVANYSPDALFLDIFGASLCYCDTCKKKFRQQYGYDLPTDAKKLQNKVQDVTSFLDGNAEEFYKELRYKLKGIDDTLAITVNFSCHYPKSFRDLLDYQFSEPLLKDNWFSSAYANDVAIGQFPILAPGEASQIYNYDKPAQYAYDLSAIAAQGCRVGMYSGSQHIDGTLEIEEAKRLGGVYKELAKLDPYLSSDRTKVKSVGIIQSDRSKSITTEPFLSDAILRMKRPNPHTKAILGAMMVCEQAKLSYMVIPDISISNDFLQEFDLIILPEVYVISPNLLKQLTAYVHSGGKIIASAKSGLYNESLELQEYSILSALTGTDFVRINEEYRQNDWSAYLSAQSNSSFHGLLSVTTPPVSNFFVETKNTSAKSLAHFVLPSVACSPTEWVNWWSPPPGLKTSIPAITLNSFNKGLVLYLAYDFFTMASTETFRDSLNSFQDMLELIKVKPVIYNELQTPNIVRTAYFETPTCYQIHQVSTLPSLYQGETTAISGGHILIKNKIKKAYTVFPFRTKLSITQYRDGWSIELPSFELQQFIICEK